MSEDDSSHDFFGESGCRYSTEGHHLHSLAKSVLGRKQPDVASSRSWQWANEIYRHLLPWRVRQCSMQASRGSLLRHLMGKAGGTLPHIPGDISKHPRPVV